MLDKFRSQNMLKEGLSRYTRIGRLCSDMHVDPAYLTRIPMCCSCIVPVGSSELDSGKIRMCMDLSKLVQGVLCHRVSATRFCSGAHLTRFKRPIFHTRVKGVRGPSKGSCGMQLLSWVVLHQNDASI